MRSSSLKLKLQRFGYETPAFWLPKSSCLAKLKLNQVYELRNFYKISALLNQSSQKVFTTTFMVKLQTAELWLFNQNLNLH